MSRGKLIGVAEIAEWAGVAEVTARGWASSDGFPKPVYDRGRVRVWSTESAHRWLVANGKVEA